MFNETLSQNLKNLAPYWSRMLIDSFGIGTEYNMIISLLLSEFITYICTFIQNPILLICVIMMLYGLYRMKPLSFKLDTFKYLQFSGTETADDFTYDDTLLALCHYICNHYKINNLKHMHKQGSHRTYTLLSNMTDYKLKDDLYLTVTRYQNTCNTNQIVVNVSLYTKHLDLTSEVQQALEAYKFKFADLNIMKLIGIERTNLLEYTSTMLAVTHVLINKYNMNKLICYDNVIEEKEKQVRLEGRVKSKRDDNTNTSTSYMSTLHKKIYTIDSISNYELEDDLCISISRTYKDDICTVTYILSSKTKNLSRLIEQWVESYSEPSYKYRLVLDAQTIVAKWGELGLSFSNIARAVNYALINKFNVNKLRHVIPKNYGYNENDAIYMIENVTNLKLPINQIDFILISIKRNDMLDTTYTKFDSYEYIIESNTINPIHFIDECVKDYKIYRNSINKNKIYHFIYNGLNKDNDLQFTKSLLTDFDDEENTLYETFDNMHNEHVATFKQDIQQLHNLTYYKFTGLKRKKSYLFHGKPGTGKTSTVIAMALFDRRHILEIPFSILTKQDELTKIMNLEYIHDIPIIKNNIIILFDEIDIGLSKYVKNTNESVTDSSNLKGVDKEDKAEETKKDKSDKALVLSIDYKEPEKNEIKLDTILSRLDGIGNYNGLILVATTMHIEKLEPALYRELRLTPIEFDYLRKIDVINLIEKLFKHKIADVFKDLIPDRTISPARLMYLCDKHKTMDLDTFMRDVICVKA